MKRLVWLAFFLLSVSPLFALQTNLVDDVIHMSRSGVADETIIEFVQTSRERFDVSADDIIAMNKAGVSEQVIKAVIAIASASDKPATAAEAPAQPADQPPAQQPATPETTDQAGQPPQPGCLTFDPPISLAFPYYGPLYPPQLWDPYWYMPRLDTKSAPPVTTERAARGASEARPSSHPLEAGPPHPSGERESHPPERAGNHTSPARRK